MIRHCKWCGRFVRADAVPIGGWNLKREWVRQLLCQECGPRWESMAEANARALGIKA